VGPIDAIVHLVNFFLPALFLGGFGAGAAKLLWRRELKSVPWRRLGAWGSGGAALALVAGLLVFGRDGKMAGYGVMALACAGAQWWVAFGARSR